MYVCPKGCTKEQEDSFEYMCCAYFLKGPFNFTGEDIGGHFDKEGDGEFYIKKDGSIEINGILTKKDESRLTYGFNNTKPYNFISNEIAIDDKGKAYYFYYNSREGLRVISSSSGKVLKRPPKKLKKEIEEYINSFNFSDFSTLDRALPKAVADFIPNATWKDINDNPEVFRFLVKTGWVKDVNL